MPELWLIKTDNGAVKPASDHDLEILRSLPVYQAFKAKTGNYRDRVHHRRMMSLFRFYWANFDPPTTEYKGQTVTMPYDRFRSDVMCIMGYFSYVTNWKGDVRMEPDSLSFSKCTEEKARRIYSDLLDFGAARIFTGDMTREKVEKMSEEWLRYNT